MFSADAAGNPRAKKFSRPWMKVAMLLAVSMGLFWFSEQFSPANLFEPQSAGWVLWVSYAKDLIQPFAFYLFLCLGERWLNSWQARALLAFAIPTLLEVGQYLYYPFFSGHYVGSFDPLDIFMYAIGIGFAIAVEQGIFAKWFKFG